jgi:AraC family transcriptional regulator
MRERTANALATIEAELCVSVATAQLVRFDLAEPVDNVMKHESVYRFDLSLTPRMRNARACYCNHWSANRFERLGDIFVVPPGEAMQARSDGGHQASIVCKLRPELIRTWFGGELEWTDRRLQAGLDISDANIRRLLLRLAEEMRHPGFASAMLVELVAGQMAIELGRYCANITEGPVSGGLAAWRLRLIDERLREARVLPTLDELARLCRLSVRQLTRGFRESRGCSIGEYVANCRLDHAKRLLATDTSVKAVAYSLGFSSPSSFCYAFRKATSETPQQFRQRVLRLVQ